MFPAGNRKIKVNMNYQKIYNDLIFKRKALQPLDVIHVFGIGRGNVGKYDGNYTETHHIVLKACGGSDDPSNLVVLTAREHFVAHKLLLYIYAGTKYENAVADAFWRMTTCHKDNAYGIIRSSRIFAKLRHKALAIRSINRRGRKRITNGKVEKYVKLDELQNYLNLGWKLGSLPISIERRIKVSNSLKGIKRQYLIERMRKQMTKLRQGKTPWNKGKKLRPLTEQEKQIRSRNANGRKHFTNGIKNIFVRPENVPEGFYPGITSKGK